MTKQRVALQVAALLLVIVAVAGCSPQMNRLIGLQAFARAGASADTQRRVDCIMYRESRYRAGVRAFNSNGTTDSGLFQINSIHAARWQRVTGESYWSTWSNAFFNARVAVDLWREAGLSPWGGGCYR